jgi:uncharacterized protein
MGPPAAARRFRRLSRTVVLGRSVPIGRGIRGRVLGLALLSRERAGPGLLIPRCFSVHTWGMRFDLDLYFLDRGGAVIFVADRVPPRRVVRRRRAAAVLEIPSRGQLVGFRSGRARVIEDAIRSEGARVRAMFAVYLGGIMAGLAYFIVIGLTHH